MAETPTHKLHFDGLPACHRHWLSRHRWWCRACDRVTEAEMRDTVHALWEAQGAGDRIIR